jgi:Ni,Fe-hydrogenase I large subunit
LRIEKKVLLRVEGHAQLELEWEDGVIVDVRVHALGSRGIEKVLEGRPLMDAMVITPRVCGICGHAHLMASVKAVENLLGWVEIPEKAKIVREITLSLERIQNHIKWFYLFLMPDFIRLGENLPDLEPYRGLTWKMAIYVSSEVTKAIALFSGQWPHASYAVPGGITSHPDNHQVNLALQILEKIKDFFLEKMVGMKRDEYEKIEKLGLWERLKGDIGTFIELTLEHGLDNKGKSYNRMLTSDYVISSSPEKKIFPIEYNKIQIHPNSPYSETNIVRYKGLPYETGPLARMCLAENQMVKRLFKNYGSTFLSRVLARVLEIWKLLLEVEKHLNNLLSIINEPSCVDLMDKVNKLSGENIGVVEASRGTLIHKVKAEKGRIVEYRIITPSMWNIGPRCKKFLGVAEKAMLGIDNPIHAEMVLKSFDVCSVCTVR